MPKSCKDKDCRCTTYLARYAYWKGIKDEEGIPLAEARKMGCAWAKRMAARKRRSKRGKRR
jgi:hypothetical protein